ncbi:MULTISPECIES: phage tail-collar fiber domain-containing protein [Enterobacter cloacae complex]|uniref:phage tail-collar fiber domain-containing protein n=1 Tax=Enterobacter cloacae complex TaxID=354276 RepID=UPI000B50071B|nr:MULTISPECIES: phage tail protein [unclassified Enterobacter cloacae complex]ASD61559.1 phage tail protein [Enterobacter cloacae complex sp. ECNIH7]MBW4187191.1 phage tail protein [Enterobacter kobei]POV38706.1 phage tail protein [Enterobacter cloacae complex sp. ECNIH11]POV43007.1 phage tail protein [Enterobacter cloacae complex sp. ECNIH16]
MATKYYAVLTNVGAAKLANATALGVQVEITQMAVGDGNGALPTPNPAQKALVHELRRAPLNTLSIDPNNANQIIAEQVIPEDVGGWWIREIGLFDKDGDMIAVANCAETYKPQLQEGSGRVQIVRMILIVSSTAAVTLKIDPSVVLATRQYVDDQIIQVKAYVDQQLAAHIAAADPHKQYAPKESPALTGTPTAPTATAGNNSMQIANTAFVQAALVAMIGGAPTALDTLKEIAAAINNDPNFSTTIGNALALKAPLASPAMTGTPTAPTAAQTVNNTQIATTAFVKSAISALVASSPAALDTLNELAAALGNDPNFATTVTNALAGKMEISKNGADIADVTAFLNSLGLGVGSALPVGVPVPWPLATPPNGWLKCNGAVFNKTNYPKLAVAYPSGNLPDLRGEFLRGWDDGRGVDSGRALLSMQSDDFKTHEHKFLGSGGQSGSATVFGTTPNTNNIYTNAFSQPGGGTLNAFQNPGGTETRPRNVAFNYIVRAA